MAHHEFSLPVPPTANLLWRVFPVKTKGGKVGFRPVPSKDYDRWKARAAPYLPEGDREIYKANPQLGWGFWFWLNINHGSDIDNRVKATIDLVAKHYGLFDRWLDEIHVYRATETDLDDPITPGMGRVYIRTKGGGGGNAGQDDDPAT